MICTRAFKELYSQKSALNYTISFVNNTFESRNRIS